MNFTPQETRLIERLKKSDQQWRWLRWRMLGIGIFFIGLSAGAGYILHGLIMETQAGHFGRQTVFFIVLMWTKCCFYFVFGVYSVSMVCMKWHGDVNRMLLLRLLDAQQRMLQQ